LSFFITTDQYKHYYVLNTLHIFTVDKKNHYAKHSRDATRGGAAAVQRGELPRYPCRSTGISTSSLNNSMLLFHITAET